MAKRIFLLVIALPNFLFSQTPPFQVLTARNAAVYGKAIEPMQYIDDVSTIQVEPGGFLSLVHQGGTTYEITEKIFTFYLKPEPLKNRDQRPELEILYSDSIAGSPEEIKVLHPPVNASLGLECKSDDPVKILWSKIGNDHTRYKISLFYNSGGKIQDFSTTQNEIVLRHSTFGLTEPTFTFKLSSNFAGETEESELYTVSLVEAGTGYPTKASDLVIKALDLDINPSLALGVWKELLSMPNGKEYFDLYEKFINRHSSRLTSAGADVEQLLSKGE